MRTLAAAALATLLAGPALGAEDPPVIEVEVGKEHTPLGIMPRCDDLTVVGISADGRGVKGLRPGETLCSFDVSGGGGARRVWRIVVVEPPSGEQSKGDRPR